MWPRICAALKCVRPPSLAGAVLALRPADFVSLSKAKLHGMLSMKLKNLKCSRLAVGLSAGAGFYISSGDETYCMPPRKKSGGKEPVHVDMRPLASEEDAQAALCAPVAEATPLPVPVPVSHVEDATEREVWSRKKSRIYEAYAKDPSDSTRCVGQSTENVTDGDVCGENLACFTASLWTHLKAKHPLLWKELKGTGSGSQWLGSANTSVAAASGAPVEGSAQLACVVSRTNRWWTHYVAPPKRRFQMRLQHSSRQERVRPSPCWTARSTDTTHRQTAVSPL